MIVHKCDRCGTVYDTYNTDGRKPNGFEFITRFNQGGHTDHKSYELCPGCLTYLQDWVTMGKKEVNNDNTD